MIFFSYASGQISDLDYNMIDMNWLIDTEIYINSYVVHIAIRCVI